MNTTITSHGFDFDLRAIELGEDAQIAFDAIERELDALPAETVAAFHADTTVEALDDIASRGVAEVTKDWRADWYKSGASPFVSITAV